MDGAIVSDVDKYANKAVGRFILVVSRFGAEAAAAGTQMRVYRDSNTVVLVLSDERLLEMVARKERGQAAEDVIEDALDEFLLEILAASGPVGEFDHVHRTSPR